LGPWLFSLLEVPPQLAGMTSQARHYWVPLAPEDVSRLIE
jgi:hypothetical protein